MAIVNLEILCKCERELAHNAATRRMLNTMLSSGLFVNQETLNEHRRMRDAAVYTSQRNMAPFIAKYI